ncbi:DUF4330 domain-containing protein [Agathobaculum butyriciproducens]|jgi:hypothetical protein|uniref:DUF4330 domain-containing protein n=1 Tax=Agathobaculum hominis TaxID=2763014 RepID=A0ABR7GK89_9FIRM|nr:DUF4330 domain-containing protein [Agathobaculum hominis]MBC5694721.1 DUF4330 domain-containing protein [Agathobaculum hominis]MCO7159164.1 DUF4330 domain-containing protein [Agathobaculum butyriciproducens]MEE0389945.1 DUF4330 domain-containing protein [Agathobaculum sp.]
MKIINEKGKLFGLINIVDLLVLIAAVAVAAGVGYKLFAPQIKESVQPQVELTAIVRVRGATPFLVTEVERNSQVGKQLVSGNSYVNGTIEDMKIEDYAQQVTTADGRIVTAVDPDKKDIVFTIKTTVPKGTATPSIGTQEVRAGRTFIVKTNDFETSGNIDSVDIAD